MTDVNKLKTKDLVPGVYSAFGRFINSTLDFLKADDKYLCALSIGWNPVYNDTEKTIEVYIMHDFKSHDFHG